MVKLQYSFNINIINNFKMQLWKLSIILKKYFYNLLLFKKLIVILKRKLKFFNFYKVYLALF